jgi:bifunctional non-homologous end joining protein LigD
MGLEGLVSKHRDSAYRGGRFERWIKVKNRQHPAFSRVMDTFELSPSARRCFFPE